MEKASTVRFILMLTALSAVMIGNVFVLSVISEINFAGVSWSTFLPDLIVGILTTGGLGVLLYFFTRRIEISAEQRGRRLSLMSEWRATWFWLGEVSVVEKEAVPSLESLHHLGLGSHLAKVNGARLLEWSQELGGEELSALVIAADRCRFMVHLGELLDKRISELSVRGNVQNINEPMEVARAMRAIIIGRESELASLVGPTVAERALVDAQRLLRMYDAVSRWSSLHFESMMSAVTEGPGLGRNRDKDES